MITWYENVQARYRTFKLLKQSLLAISTQGLQRFVDGIE